MSIDETPEAALASADARIAELEAKVAELAALVEHRTTAPADEVRAPASGARSAGSRRHLFQLAAGAAAGGTALALARGGTVAAADGDPVRVGQVVEQGSSGPTSTVVRYTDTGVPEVPAAGGGGATESANVMTVRDEPDGTPDFNPDQSSRPAALAGYAYSTVENGVYGYSQTGGHGVVGVGGGADGAGVLAFGSRANLDLTPFGATPPSRLDPHAVGEVVADGTGGLWFCVGGGSPGIWRKLAGPTTAGAFHAVTPFRVYDSREAVPDGAGLGGSTDNTISVADARDVETYAVTVPDAVPNGATAISANVVAINTAGGGFATINPGGDTSVGAAALNWGDGATVGNAGIFRISASRQLSVLVRGITNIDLTIDVTGYWR